MGNTLGIALDKIVRALEAGEIPYMIVGGFAVCYYNRSRTTNDIDLVLQIRPDQVGNILQAFPLWQGFEESFQEDIRKGILFNLTDFDTGIRYDFISFQESSYNQEAFGRRTLVRFFGINCFISSKEDLVISKFRWHNISPSEKQMEDIQFFLLDDSLDKSYIGRWADILKLDTYGLLG